MIHRYDIEAGSANGAAFFWISPTYPSFKRPLKSFDIQGYLQNYDIWFSLNVSKVRDIQHLTGNTCKIF
jgi:hypothetical protein